MDRVTSFFSSPIIYNVARFCFVASVAYFGYRAVKWLVNRYYYAPDSTEAKANDQANKHLRKDPSQTIAPPPSPDSIDPSAKPVDQATKQLQKDPSQTTAPTPSTSPASIDPSPKPSKATSEAKVNDQALQNLKKDPEGQVAAPAPRRPDTPMPQPFQPPKSSQPPLPITTPPTSSAASTNPSSQPVPATSSPQNLNPASTIKPYFPQGQQALDHAQQLLAASRDLAPFSFAHKLLPVNAVIQQLSSLYYQLLKTHSTLTQEKDAWVPGSPAFEALLANADSLVDVAYSVSSLTLDDIPAFAAREGRTYEHALVEQDSYLYRTFFFYPSVFSWLFGSTVYQKTQYDYMDFVYPKSHKDKHYPQFGVEGTRQHRWTLLYNDYCDRVDHYVDREILNGKKRPENLSGQSRDTRFVNWTRKFTTAKEFRFSPDTQPT